MFTHVTGSARRTGVVLFGAGTGVVVVLALLAVWAIGQVLDGYLITPKIQGATSL